MTGSPVLALAGWELRTALRSRWAQATGALFVVACGATAYSGIRTFRELGLLGIGGAIDGLVALAVLLPTLVALVLGANAVASSRERGLLAMLASQPVPRAGIVTGAFLGVTGAVSVTVAAGLGAALLLVSGTIDGTGLVSMAALAVAVVGMIAASASVGVALSTVASDRLQAIALAVGAWFLFALGIDLVVAVIAPAIRMGPLGMLSAVAVNPLEAGRLLTLSAASPDPEVLGPLGAYLEDLVGRWGTTAVFGGILTAWTVVPLLLARTFIRRRDI